MAVNRARLVNKTTEIQSRDLNRENRDDLVDVFRLRFLGGMAEHEKGGPGPPVLVGQLHEARE